MVNAVISDACPFCGYEFSSNGPEGLKECYNDLIDMAPAIGSMDFSTIKAVVRFVFHPDFEANKETLSKHLDLLGDIFGMAVVESDEVQKTPPAQEKIKTPPPPPPPDDITLPSEPVRKGKSPGPIKTAGAKNTKIRRRGDSTGSQPVQTASVPSGTFLSRDAIDSLPEEFRARAMEVNSDEDLRALMRDVAFSGVEGLDNE